MKVRIRLESQGFGLSETIVAGCQFMFSPKWEKWNPLHCEVPFQAGAGPNGRA